MPQNRAPDNVLKMRGTYRPDRHGRPEDKPQIEAVVLSPPDFLPPEAQREFRRVAKILGDAKLTTELNIASLAQYAVLWAEFQAQPYGRNATWHQSFRLAQQECGITMISMGKLRVLEKAATSENPFVQI